jgi:hypothetical protein
MFARRSCQLGHRALGKPRPIRGASVQRCHAAAGPTEDRFKLCDRCAVLGGARRADLADTVRALRDAGRKDLASSVVQLSRWP